MLGFAFHFMANEEWYTAEHDTDKRERRAQLVSWVASARSALI